MNYNHLKGKWRAKPVTWNDQSFDSLEDMARSFNTSAQRLRYYLKKERPFLNHLINYES